MFTLFDADSIYQEYFLLLAILSRLGLFPLKDHFDLILSKFLSYYSDELAKTLTQKWALLRLILIFL